MKGVKSDVIVSRFIEGCLLDAIKPLNILSDNITDENVKKEIKDIIDRIVKLEV